MKGKIIQIQVAGTRNQFLAILTENSEVWYCDIEKDVNKFDKLVSTQDWINKK